jgi:hypothetical protein
VGDRSKVVEIVSGDLRGELARLKAAVDSGVQLPTQDRTRPSAAGKPGFCFTPFTRSGRAWVCLAQIVLIGIARPHPPAGASTLIVSLGILTTPAQLGTMMLAVLLLTAAGWGLNTALGLAGAEQGKRQEAA